MKNVEMCSTIYTGASLHLNNGPTFQHISVHFKEGEALILPF
jgi:hypothetical protein